MDGKGTEWNRPEAPRTDPERFARLVTEQYAPALRYAARLLRHDAEAEDCVQEAFAEAFTELHTLREPEAISGWLRSIVRHRCLRRLRRRDLQLVPFATDLDALAEGSREELLTGSAARSERLGIAQRLLQILPAHERELVLLFYVKECSQQEVASFLGLPLSTVNNRLHDARQRMKEWEANMDTRQSESTARESDRLSRIGTLVHLNGPLVEARFDPDAPLDLFDAVAVVAHDGQAVERMKIAHRLGEGRVQCLLTGGTEALHPGMSLLNTGRVGVAFTPLSRVPSVTAENLLRTVDALRGPTESAPRFLATGIKAIDLLCPLAAKGVAVQAGSAGVGRVALLDELAARLGKTEELTFLCLVDRSEHDAYRGWGETDLQGSKDGSRYYWALSDQGTDPELGALDACDAVLYLSPILAIAGLYPTIDAEHSRSRLLRPEIVGSEHCAIAERARAALLFAKRAQADPVLLELLACRAWVAARRRAKSFTAEREGVDGVEFARARKLQKFLTQPFTSAEEYTGWPGVAVSVEDTLQGCRAILDGDADDLPEGAFAYAGSLGHVRELARGHTARSFG